MKERSLKILLFLLAIALWPLMLRADDAVAKPNPNATSFYVIPVKDAIDKPVLFAIRNGVKEAVALEMDYVVLDMDTPGGRLDVTLEIMEILDRFSGKTITYVNDEAISAGAIIASVTNEIYFAPKGTMGSAEPVSGQGEDIQDSMKRKIMSYLNAKMEAYTDEYPFRSEVIRAMMDPDFEFKIGETMIKEKGALLNLTAKRAHQEYGDPPVPLLGSGIADDLDALLGSLAINGEKEVITFEATWSLDLANFLVTIAPVLFAIGMLTVYIEFQTPGFGVPGIVGACCFIIGMFGHHVAGLSGHEAMIVFFIGVCLLFLEIFLMPGSLFLAIPGMLLMLGSLIWSMTDVWPANTPGFEWSVDMIQRPLINLMLGFALGIVMILAVARFLPKSEFFGHMILSATIDSDSQKNLDSVSDSDANSIVGKVGIATTDLFPGGEIEVDGVRYEAHASGGMLARGAAVRVIRRAQFGFEVEEVQS